MNSVVVAIHPEQRTTLLRKYPSHYYITEHYASHPVMLIRLTRISRAELERCARTPFGRNCVKNLSIWSRFRGRIGRATYFGPVHLSGYLIGVDLIASAGRGREVFDGVCAGRLATLASARGGVAALSIIRRGADVVDVWDTTGFGASAA